ncbi:MAG: Spy/CpxP family protein refolding chaperone [Thermodesulfobacteriota bacterium]
MQIRLKQGLIFMAAILLMFSTISYAEPQTQKGVIVHDAMTRGHGGIPIGPEAGHPEGAHKAGYKGCSKKAGHPGGHHGWKTTLSKDQRDKIEAMHLALSRDMAPLKANLALKRAELKNMVTVDDPNIVAVKAKIKKIGAIKTKMLQKRYSHIVDMRKVLTPKQRLSFDLELISDTEHWQGGHKGGHKGGGHHPMGH